KKYLTADGRIMAEAAFPHGAGGGPGEQEPASLNRQRLHERHTLKSAEENGDGAKQLVIERQPFHYGLDADGHDVDREHLAAQKIFERVDNENDGRDFKDPKGHHGQDVSDEEL